MKINGYKDYEIFQTGSLCWLTFEGKTIAAYSPNYSQEVIKDIEAHQKSLEWAKDRFIAGEGNWI